MTVADSLRKANLRLCRLRIWPDYEGFGFNLKSPSKPPYIIEFIEPYSPAATGGLQRFDVILAIDNQNISSTNHNQIITSITQARNNNGRIELLVVGKQSYRLLIKKKIEIDAKYATVINTPQKMPIEYQNYLKYQPRSCEIYLHKSNEKFGFDIADDDDEIGASIKRIHSDTPASHTILRPNDRIIEINNKSVEKKFKKSIFKKLEHAKLKGYIKLYVMDVETYQYYQSNQISLSSKIHRKNQSTTIKRNDRENFHSDKHTLSKTSDNHTTESSNEAIHIQKKYHMTLNKNENLRPTIGICKGDLITQQTDVIVVCSSSQYLFDSVCQAGGTFLSEAYNAEIKKNTNESVIAIRACGKLASRQIYFLSWTADSNTRILQKSIKKFVSDAMEKAAKENYKSIAFPAIGCGKFGCSISLIAQTMLEEADHQLSIHKISVLFVIQSDRTDIYDEFQQKIISLESSKENEAISTTVGQGIIQVEQGDITMQKVDVIISGSSSELLKTTIIRAAGNEVQTAYNNEYRKNPNSILIVTSPGLLNCKRIFFLKWESTVDKEILQQSFIDLMSMIIQNMGAYNFTSIAFPAIGCGRNGCSLDIAVRTVVREMKNQLIKRNLSWTVKFIIQSHQIEIYDEFCKQVLTTSNDFMESQIIEFPSTWEVSKMDKVRIILSTTSDEYKPIASNFDHAMQGKYTQIIRIERIQNERCYLQYLAHSKDFRKRLNMDTEKRLYHGCPEQAADSIIKGYFNRSLAGVNGTFYGKGVYFSSNAAYSHGFADANQKGERCMFVVRVLVGKTTKGNSAMKTPPDGFDSTTDEKHIFVTYHDAQVLAEYLITYK